MTQFILSLIDPAATDPENVGPKAANLARLTQAGLPTPGGFALTAEAYRHQLNRIGIDEMLASYNDADIPTFRHRGGCRLPSAWRSISGRSRPRFSSRCSPPGAPNAPTDRWGRCVPPR